jgi:Mce-associated membrane protein
MTPAMTPAMTESATQTASGTQMTEPDQPAVDSAPGSRRRWTTPAWLTPRLSRGIAVVLAVVAVVALVVVVLELAVLRPRYQEVVAESRARTAAAQAAEQFAARVNNYEVESIEGYQAGITPLLTTKFQAEFEKAMGDIVTSVKEAEMSSEGKVLTSAVSSVDADSAEVLVVADASVKTVFDTRARHFRWEVSLVKVDGEWLVDNFSPVG